jgi:hypothetical protein
MALETQIILEGLINQISGISNVSSIGISKSKASIPNPGEGDIDVFIYCDRIPKTEERQSAFNDFKSIIADVNYNILQGGHWGVGDFAAVNGVEVWFMYFTLDETTTQIEAILKGENPEKLDNYYYPIGRCAMLKEMNILYDENGFLAGLKEMLLLYPDQLAGILTEHHMKELKDTEDLERAAARADVLFYHFALDIAIDHFLQALFAMNKTFFPSRKRNLEFIEEFKLKPEGCSERLLEVVALGSTSEGIGTSFNQWVKLKNELVGLWQV